MTRNTTTMQLNNVRYTDLEPLSGSVTASDTNPTDPLISESNNHHIAESDVDIVANDQPKNDKSVHTLLVPGAQSANMNEIPHHPKMHAPVRVPSTPSGNEMNTGSKRLKKQGQLADAIANIIKDVPRGTHLTATEVFRRAQDAGLNVSLSTVYRTLNLLQQHGNVSTVSGEHGRRYEAKDDDHDHDHLICLKCGLTIEFADDLLRGFGKALAERKGYEHKSSRFDILGICGDCKAKDEDHKVSTALISVETAIGMGDSTLVELRACANALDARKLPKAIDTLSICIPALREIVDELENTINSLRGAAVIE